MIVHENPIAKLSRFKENTTHIEKPNTAAIALKLGTNSPVMPTIESLDASKEVKANQTCKTRPFFIFM